MIVANASSDRRSVRFISDGRKRRRGCSYCPDNLNRATHVGMANAVAMMQACEFHARQWAHRPPKYSESRKTH